MTTRRKNGLAETEKVGETLQNAPRISDQAQRHGPIIASCQSFWARPWKVQEGRHEYGSLGAGYALLV